ncbi:MAG: site-specific DNA-methyltransferase [Cellvibrionales bacterium]|nr:site-specific DNA-methyltransferase [Cellvibrionales bacterium]
MNTTSWENRLCYGDCLTILQDMPPESVDLIYLDPPFNSNRDYNAIYKDETGRPLPDQIEAFCDSWALDAVRERAIRDMPILMREAGVEDELAEFWRAWPNALRKTQPRLLAYLSYMTERLLSMRRLLKPTGSIYLHCDPTASHYLKIIMDAVFGHGNFLNEIIWSYRTGGVSKHWFGRKHDVLLYYARSKGSHVFHVAKEKSYNRDNKPYRFKGVEEFQDAEGKWYTMASMRDVWELNAIGRSSKERLGYATQKPLALLERIIKASSNEGDLVLDPFCGCATTIEAAHRLGRRWVGIDIAIHAIKRVAAVRLQDRLGLKDGIDFVIEGVPHSLEGARDLWRRDPYHFQKWAVEQVDGFVTARKAADGGIDGRLYFDTGGKQLESMLLEVKGGANVGIGVVRDLRGVLEREGVPMAGLILLEEPAQRKERNFQQEMAQAGDLEVNGVLYPRMQMLSVAEILAGKRFRTPSVARGRGEPQPNLSLS